jgi:outer membrane protein W
VVERGGLENRWALRCPVGSNPTLSARYYVASDDNQIQPYDMRRGAGVDEQAALEMQCRGDSTVGSNPTLSAR